MNAHGLATIAASNYIVSTLRKNMRYEGPCRIFIFDNKDELSAALGVGPDTANGSNDTAGSAGSLNSIHLRFFDFRGVPFAGGLTEPARCRRGGSVKEHKASEMHHYRSLCAMLIASFAAMYVLMYAMTSRFDDVFMNFNQVYMAALMTAPMALIEITIMRSMYTDRRANWTVLGIGLIVLAGSWTSIRQQALISDAQFLRSMIPHHSSAILMCQRAAITDLEIMKLCEGIVSSQQLEIDQMKAKLRQRQ